MLGDSVAAGLTLPPESQDSDTRGGSHPPNEASGGDRTSQRICRLPLEIPSGECWRDLRRLAYQCAAYGNHCLSDAYLRAKGGPTFPTYTDAKHALSAAIRDAVGRECVGIWRRLGKKILRGEQTLARFSADRALSVRDRGVRVALDEAGHVVVRLRLHPQDVGAVTILRVYAPAVRRVPWLRDLVARIVAGEVPITKATLQFIRPGRKLALRVAYAVPVRAAVEEGLTATFTAQSGLVPSVELRAENGHAMSMSDRAVALASLKAHFEGIHERLRRTLGKRGRRYAHRRALAKVGTFEEAAAGPLHTWSRAIVTWCQREGVGRVCWAVDGDESLPWFRLRQMTTYKAQAVGIVVCVSQIEALATQASELRSADAGSDGEVPGGASQPERLRGTVQRGEE